MANFSAEEVSALQEGGNEITKPAKGYIQFAYGASCLRYMGTFSNSKERDILEQIVMELLMILLISRALLFLYLHQITLLSHKRNAFSSSIGSIDGNAMEIKRGNSRGRIDFDAITKPSQKKLFKEEKISQGASDSKTMGAPNSLTIGGVSATASISPCGNNAPAPAPAVASSGTSSLLPVSDGDSCKSWSTPLGPSGQESWSTLTLQASQVFSKKSPDTGSADIKELGVFGSDGAVSDSINTNQRLGGGFAI
uniref:Uncharacterized protein n=1 Tax=Quercus lobata TaxID=97700 RepID=A0A7N2MHM3_QUELO